MILSMTRRLDQTAGSRRKKSWPDLRANTCFFRRRRLREGSVVTSRSRHGVMDPKLEDSARNWVLGYPGASRLEIEQVDISIFILRVNMVSFAATRTMRSSVGSAFSGAEGLLPRNRRPPPRLTQQPPASSGNERNEPR
jgi:hypothetical protein